MYIVTIQIILDAHILTNIPKHVIARSKLDSTPTVYTPAYTYVINYSARYIDYNCRTSISFHYKCDIWPYMLFKPLLCCNSNPTVILEDMRYLWVGFAISV